jgi:uncharacterized protein
MPDGWSRVSDIGLLASRGSEVDFSIPLAELPRLAPSLAHCEGTATGRARFSPQQGFAAAELAVRASLPLTCQRCLGEMRLDVDSVARIALAPDADAIDRVPPEFEAVLAPGGQITVRDLVDEQLLLELPVVALHADPSACARDMSAGVKPARVVAEEKQRPFAGLGAMFGAGRTEEHEEK